MTFAAALNWMEALRWCGTIGLILTSPIWAPIIFVVYEINWRGMLDDLRRMHEHLWRG